MEFFAENLYTVILIPFWASLLILLGKLFGVVNSKKVINIISLCAALYCLIFSIGAFACTALQKGYVFENSVSFLDISKFNFSIGTFVDGVSTWMLLLAVVISLAVQIYSFSYMKHDKSYVRFFAYLNFFNFAMFGLILSANLFQMFIFWELVGVASYLLIGFWYKKDEAVKAAKKAFITNSIGDFSFLAGIILSAYIILSNLGNFASVALPFSEMPEISAQIYGCTSDGIYILTCVLLLIGAIAKSAQFPLHTWLIDAMEGPVPVSALIHSATMVAAGVFLIVRLYPVFSLSNAIMTIISVIGVITALMCSYSALTQTDIKKVLAYSTNAQTGLMFIAAGSCSVTVSMLHLTAHAVAKAMLFLSAGCVIYALHSKDIKSAGGLRKYMPVTAFTFLIGILSLSGILFSGFTSKELILGGLFAEKHYIYAILLLIVAFMTTYYLFRLYFFLFEGKQRFDFEIRKPERTLYFVPVVLALFVILLWFVLPKSGNIPLIITNLILSVFAIVTAYLVCKYQSTIKKVPLFYDISYNAFYAEAVNNYIIRVFRRLAKTAVLIEKYVFDGIAYLSSFIVRLSALCFSKMETGNIQSYIAYSLFTIMLCFGGVMLVYSLIFYFSEVQ